MNTQIKAYLAALENASEAKRNIAALIAQLPGIDTYHLQTHMALRKHPSETIRARISDLTREGRVKIVGEANIANRAYNKYEAVTNEDEQAELAGEYRRAQFERWAKRIDTFEDFLPGDVVSRIKRESAQKQTA